MALFQVCPLHSIPRPSRPVTVRAFGGKTAGNGANHIRRHCDSRRCRPRTVVGDWCDKPRAVIGEMEGTHWRGLSRPFTGMGLFKEKYSVEF